MFWLNYIVSDIGYDIVCNIVYYIFTLYVLCFDLGILVDVLECQRDSILPLAFHEIVHTPTGCSRLCGDGCEGRRQDCQ